MSDNASMALRQLIVSALGELHTNHLMLEKLFRVASLFLSFLAAYIFYEYIEYLIILNACNYEKSSKKRYNFVRRMANRLEYLSREQCDFYYCFLPMSHGLNFPSTQTLFKAITEILNGNSRPASRRICMSILTELAESDYCAEFGRIFKEQMPVRRQITLENYNYSDMDPLSEFNLSIMQFTREMVIYGVKDLEIMTILHRLIDTNNENS